MWDRALRLTSQLRFLEKPHVASTTRASRTQHQPRWSPNACHHLQVVHDLPKDIEGTTCPYLELLSTLPQLCGSGMSVLKITTGVACLPRVPLGCLTRVRGFYELLPICLGRFMSTHLARCGCVVRRPACRLCRRLVYGSWANVHYWIFRMVTPCRRISSLI